jgi:hypothetical protein
MFNFIDHLYFYSCVGALLCPGAYNDVKTALHRVLLAAG